MNLPANVWCGNDATAVIEQRTGIPGDLGWILHRHAHIYCNEFGYDPIFESYVAKSLPSYLDNFDPALDRIWIAYQDDQRVGSIAIQHDRPGWAKLRYFLVEKEARGAGIGSKLMDAAIAFCRGKYEGITLATVDNLVVARRHYDRAGFKLIGQSPCPWYDGVEQFFELRFDDHAIVGDE